MQPPGGAPPRVPRAAAGTVGPRIWTARRNLARVRLQTRCDPVGRHVSFPDSKEHRREPVSIAPDSPTLGEG